MGTLIGINEDIHDLNSSKTVTANFSDKRWKFELVDDMGRKFIRPKPYMDSIANDCDPVASKSNNVAIIFP